MDSLTDAAAQDAIADSLLGDEPTEAMGEQYQEQDSGAEQDGEGQLSDRDQINGELWEETQRIEADSRQEAEQPSEVEVSPQAVQESIQQLDQFVGERGLVDPGESALLASALGVDRANSAPLGNVLAKVTVSALEVLGQTGGDLSKVPPISREAAVAFSNEFLRACGADPRQSNANPQQLAQVVLGGTLSFIDAVNKFGLNASMDQLNTAEASEWFANALFQCFGQTQQVDRQYALSLADSAGRYVLAVLKKLDGQRSEQPQQGRRQSQGSRSGRGQRSSGRSRFKTNADIFDSEAEEMWRVQHGRL
jgi:hypothetical protein